MISVCIATYNGEQYIEEQLISILTQLNKDDEIIISDDSSTDKTIEIIQNLNDTRIKIIHANFKNPIYNFENSLKHAKGDVIFTSDQDDVWLPDKVEKTLKELEQCDFLLSDCYVTDENLNIIQSSFFEVNSSVKNKWLALLKNPYLGCCLAFRRKILETAIPFPENIPMHDIWIGNVAAFKYKTKITNEKLIYYRRHKNNASTASEKSNNNVFKKIKHRKNLIKALLKRIIFNKRKT